MGDGCVTGAGNTAWERSSEGVERAANKFNISENYRL